MKRSLPAIIILITLSLLGLVAFQVSWFKNVLEVRRAQLLNGVYEAGKEVATDLSRFSANRMPNSRLNLTPGFGADFSFRFVKPLSIADKISVEQVNKKIKAALSERNLRDIAYEFAIVNQESELTMASSAFSKEFVDSIHNKSLPLPIIPENILLTDALNFSETLWLVVPDFKSQVWESMRWLVFAAVVFMLIIIAAFFVTVKTLLNQKKISEIKSDFINNMTHEFKTPLATISLAVDALRNEKVKTNPEKADYFSGIIKEENRRMNKHVETILQAAVMEKQELQLNLHPIHIHQLVEGIVDNYALQLDEKKGMIELKLNAGNDLLSVDEVHFTNMLSNLLDNAIKYSKDSESPVIKISTHATLKNFVVRIEDNGIGMSKETVKRVFEKFYRAHTGNVHNVKGFGLGMSYVKSVVAAHKGKIKVESILGKGTIFTLELPINLS